MFKNYISKEIFVAILIFMILLFSSLGLYVFVNSMFLMVCFGILIWNRKFLLYLYVILLPTNGFISTEFNFLGVFHITYTINLFATIAIIMEWQSFSRNGRKILYKNLGIERYAYFLALFAFLFLLLSEYRFFLLGKGDTSIFLLITRSIRYFVLFFPILMLIRLSGIFEYKQLIRNGFLFSLMILGLSMIFSDQLFELGLYTTGKFFLNPGLGGTVNRQAGFFCLLGDVNSAGGFLAVGYAFVLFLDKRYLLKTRRIALVVIIILAVLSTGSRTALVELAVISLLFVFTGSISSKQKLAMISFILLLATFLYYEDYVQSVLDRFRVLKIGEGHLDKYSTHGRLGGWFFYLEYIFSNINRFLFGVTESVYKREGADLLDERVAHNFYIQVIYLWGIFPFLILLHILYKYIKTSFYSGSKFIFLAFFIAFFITSNTVSDTGVFLGFFIAIAAFPANNPTVSNLRRQSLFTKSKT